MTLTRKELGINLALFFVIVITISVGMFYAEYEYAAAFFWPASGIYIAIYFIFRKRFLYTIIYALLITNLIWRIIMANETVLISITLSILFTVIGLIEIFSFAFLIEVFKVKVERIASVTLSIKYFVTSVIVAAISGLLGILSLSLFYNINNIVEVFLRWSIGVFLGIIVFGVLSLSSHYHDGKPNFSKTNIYHTSLYIAFFILNITYVFGDFGNNYITFANFQIIIFLLYILCAFAFSYRMIIASNLIFLTLLQVMYLQYIPEYEIVYEAIMMTIYVVVMSSIASVIRNVLQERKGNFDMQKQARENLDKIILSTNKLLSIGDKTPDEVNDFSRNYFIDMFHLACDIYSKFEKASCYINEDNKVKYIATYNYDIDFLNRIEYDAEDFTWDLFKPEIVYKTVTSKDIKKEGVYQEYKERYGDIKQSIRFTITLGENKLGGMSFDIPDGSDKMFDHNDLENFESFQNLMNGYYSIGILNYQNETLKDDIVRSSVRTLELYDSYTESHSDDVSQLCMAVADGINLNNELKRELYWSSLLHDIGKIGISSEILNKPGKLTDEEFDLIKKHPVYGYQVLSQSETLSNIAINVLHHHEWFNGSGYPKGLRKDEIPYLSQIIQVCDAVSAMSHRRVYKKAMNEEEIIKELKRYSGAQFNPDLAAFMIEFISSGKFGKLFKDKTKRD